MGKILEEYEDLIKRYRDVIPDFVYEILVEKSNSPTGQQCDNTDVKPAFLVAGYEELSRAVYTFLHSSRGPYTMGYVREFKINRLSSGFKTINELVHFAIWAVERHYKQKEEVIKSYDELRLKDNGKTKEEIFKQVAARVKFSEKIMELSMNMKTVEDLWVRNQIIEEAKAYDCVAFELVEAKSFYKQLDDIHNALSKIERVSQYYTVPEPLNQTEWELCRV